MVRAQVDKVKSHPIQSAWDNNPEHYDLHRLKSAAERLKFIDSLLADDKILFPIAESVEGGVRASNQMQRESKAANEWLLSALLLGGSNTAVDLYQILSPGE
jgi:hypothetical protein